MARRKGLGRGLDALLGSSAAGQAVSGGRDLRAVPVDLVDRSPYQPRADFDPESLEELAQSIRARGVVQPVVVRPARESGRYELVAGERRWRAAQMAGLDEIPAVVRELGDEAALAIGLVENIQREDLNPIEEATAVRRLVDEFDLTHESAAAAIGRSRAAVSNLLRLLDLEEDVRARLQRGELDMGHARALLGLSGEAQSRAAAEVVAKDLTARATEALVRRLKSGDGAAPRRRATVDPDVRRLQDELGERLGAAVRIEQGRGGRGRLVIAYGSLEELDGILERIR